MTSMIRIPCALMRGGTSKGMIIKKIHLPQDRVLQDQAILRIFGSPDQRQIDGIGGANPLSSKLAIVGPPTHPGAHVNYTFGQVSLDKEEIDYKPTCGNMSTAVGLFAVEEGYVPLTEPVTTVKIYSTNIDKLIEVDVPVLDGKIQYDGDFAIAGVPGTAARLTVNFLDSGGSITGQLLPTGNAKDTVKLEDGRLIEASVIDCANLVIFVNAQQLNIKGTEIGADFNQQELLDSLEFIRVEIGLRLGLFHDKSEVSPTSHALPKIAVIAKPQSYETSGKEFICENEIDLLGRYIAMGTLHQAFAVSGGIAAAAGARIPGTVIHDLIGAAGKNDINIGHPSGKLNVEAKVEFEQGEYKVSRAAIGRTARRIMDGFAYVPEHLFSIN